MASEEDISFIVMEYVEGLDLSRVNSKNSLSLGRQVLIALDVSRGLLYAHGQGVLHRDIKSGNILVCVVIGLTMLVAGTIAMLAGHVSNGVAAAVASIVTYFIQKIFQQREDLFRKLAKRKNAHLEYGNYWLLAIQSVDAIENPEQRAKQQSRLADVLAERLMRSPATGQRERTQKAPNSGVAPR